VAAFRDATSGAVRIAPIDEGPCLDVFSGWRYGGAPKTESRYSLDPADWLAHDSCRTPGLREWVHGWQSMPDHASGTTASASISTSASGRAKPATWSTVIAVGCGPHTSAAAW
jgi:hypothetical protein